MFRLSDGEEIMTLPFFVLIQYQSVTDGQTDIPPLAIPAVCIARYANALVKTDDVHSVDENNMMYTHCGIIGIIDALQTNKIQADKVYNSRQRLYYIT